MLTTRLHIGRACVMPPVADCRTISLVATTEMYWLFFTNTNPSYQGFHISRPKMADEQPVTPELVEAVVALCER